MDCRRVELVRMNDPAAPPTGTMGTVTRIGALGDLEVEWDDGSHLHLIRGVDEWLEKLRVVVVEPGKPAYQKYVDKTLNACQNIVGGNIDVVFPFDDPVLLVANDNAVAEGCEPNRTVNGHIIPGPFFLCGASEDDDFCSLTPEFSRKYLKIFQDPESFPTRRFRVRTCMVCPLCGREYTEHPATSRADNLTSICPGCGTREALEATGLPAVIVQDILLALEEGGLGHDPEHGKRRNA